MATQATGQHTPYPWTYDKGRIMDADGLILGGAGSAGIGERIVRAVNAHDALVAALQEATEAISGILGRWPLPMRHDDGSYSFTLPDRELVRRVEHARDVHSRARAALASVQS